MLVAHCSLLFARCSSRFARCSLRFVRCSLLLARCSEYAYEDFNELQKILKFSSDVKIKT